MKWLLVTTNPEPHLPGTNHPHGAGWNVGDQFARIGTEQAIREVDPRASIELVNMDSAESITTPRPFDRAVFAGRPMFWDNCEAHPLWVELLNGWLCKDPRKVMALGVGDCFPLPTPAPYFQERVEAARARLWRVTLRRRGFGDFCVCPAAWALLDRVEIPRRRLANLMPFGAHYPDFDVAAAQLWESRLPSTAADLQRRGFEFIAHSLDEAELAQRLGWHDSQILLATTVTDYLSIYAQASIYIGNRVHGALVLASRPAVALAICMDTRVFAVVSAGMGATHAASKELEPVCESPDFIVKRIKMIRQQRAAAVQLLKLFAQ